MKLYFDESVWKPVVEGIRRRGWDVGSVWDGDMLGEPDERQLSYAEESERVLITFDSDFVEMVRGRDDAPPVLYVDQRGKRIGEVVRKIDTYLARYTEENLEGVHYL